MATALAAGVCKWQAVYKKPKRKYLRRAKKWKAKARNQAAERYGESEGERRREGKAKEGRVVEKEVNQVKGKASERATKLLPQPRNADNFCHLILSFALFLHSRNTL